VIAGVSARQVGRAIQAARHARGMSTAGLAARMHVAPGTVVSWEAGSRNPTLLRALDLAEVLGVPVCALSGRRCPAAHAHLGAGL
jgi:transcriptional regulator with XRE-family HTH domain